MKLAHALIAKSTAETILVASLALAFYWSAFPPGFHGWGEVQSHAISGWAVNKFSPFERVEVQLFIDGRFFASGVANLARPDVRKAGWSADEWHGYVFPLPPLPAGSHEARVYALHASGRGTRQSLQLLGSTIQFVVDETGAVDVPVKASGSLAIEK